MAGLLTEPPWLGQETGHSHPGLLRGYDSRHRLFCAILLGLLATVLGTMLEYGWVERRG